MIIKALCQEYDNIADPAITEARLVRLVNIGATETITISPGPNDPGDPAELTILANTTVVLEKAYGAPLAASGSIKATIVAFTN